MFYWEISKTPQETNAKWYFGAKECGYFRLGYQGLRTLFPRGNKQIRNQYSLSFKMIPRTACHPGGAANSKNKALFRFGHQTIWSESFF